MKYIEKATNNLGECIEPENFSRWKTENEKILEEDYNNNDARTAWGRLSSSLPSIANMEEGIFYYSKNCLANSLLEEQGYLCCFCNRKIHNEEIRRVVNNDDIAALDHNDRKWTIEHVAAKSDNPRNNTYNYCNLAVSCKGGERIPQSIASYCNNGRGNKSINVNPFMEDCEELVFFSLDGNIHGITEEINNTVTDKDGLNLNYFSRDREIEIKKYFYQNYADYQIALVLQEEPPELIIKSKEEARTTIAQLSQKNESGHYEEYCSAVISVLKKNIVEI